MVTSITATMYVRFDTVSLTVDDSIVASDLSKHADIELKEDEIWLPTNDPNVIAYYEQKEAAERIEYFNELEAKIKDYTATSEEIREYMLLKVNNDIV